MSALEMITTRPPLKPEAKLVAVRERAAGLASRVDELSNEELEAANKALVDLELEYLLRKMTDGADEDYRAGKLEPADIEQAIKEYRALHPYR